MKLIFNGDEGSLIQSLRTGINIFAGAGFSVLPSPDGCCLPLGSTFAVELCNKFGFENSFGYDLPDLSELLTREYGEDQVKGFMKDRFTVKNYNPLYSNILRIKLKTFATTNIDNIFRLVVSDSNSFFIRDVLESGKAVPCESSIDYIPIHGDVTKRFSQIKFGRHEVVEADQTNSFYFDLLKSALLNFPTVFIGYSFQDSAVYQSIISSAGDFSRIWVLLLSSDDKGINYYQKIGCHVIVGDVESFLFWLGQLYSDGKLSYSSVQKNDNLRRYCVPEMSSILHTTSDDFFKIGATSWHAILSDYPFQSSYFNRIITEIVNDSKKHLLAVGLQGSGKTVLGMQLTRFFEDRAFFIPYLSSSEEALFIAKNAKKENIIIVDDCMNNAAAFNVLLGQLRDSVVIGLSENYSFETGRHLLSSPFDMVDISDLSSNDLSKLKEKIPQKLFNGKSYLSTNSKTCMLDALDAYVYGFASRKFIINLLEKIQSNNDKDVFDLLVIAAYMTINKSIVSMDVLISYFGSYEKVCSCINKLSNYVVKADSFLVSINNTQDYYVLRSHFLANAFIIIVSQKFKDEYGRILRKFISDVNPYCIPFADTFCRFAFDGKRFYEIFSDQADDLYNFIYEKYAFKEESYVLQQWALYCRACRKFDQAFRLIEKARQLNKHNFSIENAYAMIQFESNSEVKDKDVKEVMPILRDSMEILDSCYKKDLTKRHSCQDICFVCAGS
jgi:hypothetical protein